MSLILLDLLLDCNLSTTYKLSDQINKQDDLVINMLQKGTPNVIFDTQVHKQTITLIYLLRNKNDTMNWTLFRIDK